MTKPSNAASELETDPCLVLLLNAINIIFYPVTPGILIALLVILVLLFGSALMSGSEVAFFALSPTNISDLREKGTRRSSAVLSMIRSPRRLLATILIANNFINVGIVIISSFVMNATIHVSGSSALEFLFQVVVVTFLILLFGEILPKLYANQATISFALFMVYPLIVFEKILYPLSTLLLRSTSTVHKRLSQKPHNISMDDLSEALELTSRDISEEKNILKGIIKFGNIDVREIMKARLDVFSVDISLKLNELITLVVESGYSRIPVYADNFDNIKGILYIKDLLPHLNKSTLFKWQSLIRPPYYVPENKKIDDLLREFQLKKIHMAIVVDEYGGTSGIITLEDIIEEIVGEITDEVDEDEVYHEKIDDLNYYFDGKIMLNDFIKIIKRPDLNIDDIRGDADTLAGLILEHKGEIPRVKDKIELKNLLFTIESADRRRITKIKVTLPQKSSD